MVVSSTDNPISATLLNAAEFNSDGGQAIVFSGDEDGENAGNRA